MVEQTPTKISIVIRTLNEEKFLPECLGSIQSQNFNGEIETIIVDSGSTDTTLAIADNYNCKIIKISKSEFTFGRSLNLGCDNCSGDIIVLISAHCIPTDENWVTELVRPIIDGKCDYTYGRQIPRIGVSKYSEGMVFAKYYPLISAIPQKGYFCNNANSALSRETWLKYRFHETLTGLEDMEFAKRLVTAGGRVGYVSTSIVEHIHEENWKRIKIRYEREAVALSEIEPSLNLNIIQAAKMFLVGVKSDLSHANCFSTQRIAEIVRYRFCQYWGSFIGSKSSKMRVNRMKSEYFYPRFDQPSMIIGECYENDRASANESSQ